MQDHSDTLIIGPPHAYTCLAPVSIPLGWLDGRTEPRKYKKKAIKNPRWPSGPRDIRVTFKHCLQLVTLRRIMQKANYSSAAEFSYLIFPFNTRANLSNCFWKNIICWTCSVNSWPGAIFKACTQALLWQSPVLHVGYKNILKKSPTEDRTLFSIRLKQIFPGHIDYIFF